MTFEEYLNRVFMEEAGYRVLDDDPPDAFDAWLTGLDAGDVMEHAERWGRELTTNA